MNLINFLKKIKRFCLHVFNGSGMYYCGHFYSPVPSNEDITKYSRLIDDSYCLSQIAVNFDLQEEIFSKMLEEYKSIDFPEHQTLGNRYYCQNSYYSHMDGITLSMMVRIFRPKTIIEIGSGFSSAAILDTIDSISGYRPDVTFVEPNPGRLYRLIGTGQMSHIAKIVEARVQSSDLGIFKSLGQNDFIIIDSSHIVKFGSDLNFIFFHIFPLLSKGVIVHFHDIWKGFDYPAAWLMEGTYWNEAYFLRAFLSNSKCWEAIYMTDYMSALHDFEYRSKMPLCSRSAGSSFYIRKFN